MSKAFEEAIVTHCAPTLAGHKCGSLFFHRCAQGESQEETVRGADLALSFKGARVRLLKSCADGGLAYVYRPAMLAKRLAHPDVQAFLVEYGYQAFDADACMKHLAGRIHCGEGFPHEIGVFLDYPLADVIGFIEHRGYGYCCAGCWKAYGNAEAARKKFALYKKCQKVYLDCYRRGFDVARLTVAV